MIYRETKFNADKSQFAELEISTEGKRFSITSNVYEKINLRKSEYKEWINGNDFFDAKKVDGIVYDYISGGRNHEEILIFYPQYKIFVDLHFCYLNGIEFNFNANHHLNDLDFLCKYVTKQKLKSSEAINILSNLSKR